MGEWLNNILPNIPPLACYIIVGLVIGLESMGVPLPGEITLIGAILLAFQHPTLEIYLIAISGALGAILGDNLGYFIGAHWGSILLARLSKRFPHHFGAERITRVEALFHKYGVWAIFFGRFAALLRVLSGLVSGVLHIRYGKFLIANILGALVWVGLITSLVTLLGKTAEKLLARSSWTILGIIAILLIALWFKFRLKRRQNSAALSESIDN